MGILERFIEFKKGKMSFLEFLSATPEDIEIYKNKIKEFKMKQPKFIEKYNCTVTEILTEDLKLSIHILYHSTENEMNYKFKDPRDALHFLTKNWSLLPVCEVELLFNYVQYAKHLKLYTIMDFYYVLMLEIIITFLIGSKLENINQTNIFIESLKLKKVIRLSHLYAVSNTWKLYNKNRIVRYDYFKQEDELNIDDPEILYITEFNLYNKLKKVNYKDGYYLAYDDGKGTLYKVGDFNSCKITTDIVLF